MTKIAGERSSVVYLLHTDIQTSVEGHWLARRTQHRSSTGFNPLAAAV